MHRISPVSVPISSPLETGFAEDFDHLRIHVSCRTLQIRLRIQINRNSPTVRRKLNTGPLRPECKTAAEALYFWLQFLGQNIREHTCKNCGEPLVAGELTDALRMVP